MRIVESLIILFMEYVSKYYRFRFLPAAAFNGCHRLNLFNRTWTRWGIVDTFKDVL